MAWIENNISSKELIQWLAFYEYIEPFGARLIDEQRSVLSLQNYSGEEKPKVKDFNLYSYSLDTPEEKAKKAKLEAEAKSRNFREALKRQAKKKHKNNN